MLRMKMTRKQFYLICAVLGTIIPWAFFAQFFAVEGMNIPLFLQSLFINEAAGGFSADVLISMVVFLIWSFYDAKQLAVKHWWFVVLASCLVGLSLALPLYLFFREDRDQA